MTAKTPYPPLLMCVAFCTLALVSLCAGHLHAAGTPAGTILRNHAVLTFQDEDNNRYTASSNEVIMIVQPVYGISILPDGDQGAPGQVLNGVAGQTMVFPYILTFTGNTSDSATVVPSFLHGPSTFRPRTPSGITGIRVFNDLGANGVVDASDVLVGSWKDTDGDGVLDGIDSDGNGIPDGGEISDVGLGQQYAPDDFVNLLVTFAIPVGAGLGEVAFFGLDGASTGDSAAQDTVNIAEATVVDTAVLQIRKSADVQARAPGEPIVYTVTVENVGTAAATGNGYSVDGTSRTGVLIYDVVPEDANGDPLGLSLVSGSDDASAGTLIYSQQADTTTDPTGWTWSTTATPGSNTVVGYITWTLGGGSYTLGIGDTATLSFTAAVPADATDQTLSNRAYADHAETTDPVPSNEVLVMVSGAAGVVIRDTDFILPLPPRTPADDTVADLQTYDTVQAGNFVYFRNRVFNTGSARDSFNITVDGTTTNPNGWQIDLFTGDGLTPLRDTGKNGILDTGPLDPAGGDLDNPLDFTDVVVRVIVPRGAADSGNDPELNLVLEAASVRDSGKTDTTVDRIADVQRGQMSLANNVGGSPDGASIEKNAAAGEFVDFPLIVQNLAGAGGEPDSYTLSTPGLPAGWEVIYYLDTNENGQLDENELLPVATTPPVGADPADEQFLIARVAVAGDAPGGVQNLTFRATSTNDPTLSDDQADSVIVAVGTRFELRTNGQATIAPGGVTVYPHTLANYGEQANRFFLEVTPGNTAWTYLLLTADGSAQLPRAADPGDGDTVKYYLDLDAAGQGTDTVDFFLRIFAPANTPDGTLDITSILASANDPVHPATPTAALPSLPTHLVTDVTQVVSGALQLTKTSNPLPGVQVLPGDAITYTTTYFNKGTQALTAVIVYDQIPAHTQFVKGSSAHTQEAGNGITSVLFDISEDGGITWSTPGGSGADPNVTNLRARLQGDLAPGGRGDVSFDVLVE